MIASSEFQHYLQSIFTPLREDVQCWVRDRYVPTLAELPLRVQTFTSSTVNTQEQQKEKREQFAVVEGLRKYAPEHLLLVGKPGSGKSTSLRRLLWEESRCCLEAIEQDKSEIPQIPILIELRSLSGSVLTAIQEKLEWWLNLDEKNLKALLRGRRLLMLLDGLNELPNDTAWRAVDQFIQLCADFKVPLIITTRELGSGLGHLIPHKLEMLPLSESQMREFVQKRLPETGEELLRQIQGRLRELAETPLLLQMLCDVFAEKGEIPKNRGELFRKEFARRYKEFKPERLRNISEDSRRFASELLSHLAFTMVQGEPHTDPFKPSGSWITISRVQAEKILATFLVGDQAKAKEWLEDLLEWHLLQVASNSDHIEFHHQLFQEYYAAEKLLEMLQQKHPDITEDSRFQHHYLNYLKWTEPIAIMLGLPEITETQAKKLIELALDVDLMLGARLAGEVNLQFQEQTVGLVSAANLSDKAQVSDWLRVELLGRTRSKLVLPQLQQFLKNPNLDIARKALAWISFLGYREAIPALLQMLSELDRWIPEENGSRILSERTMSLELEIIEALGRLSQEDAVLKLRNFCREPPSFINFFNQPIISDLLAKFDPEFSVEESLEILKTSKDPNRIIQASELLFKLRNSDAPSRLIQRLNCEQDSEIHKAIIDALGLFDTDEAVSALTNLIKSPDLSIREEAAKTLIQYERVNAIDNLISHLDNLDRDIRWCAAVVLGKLRSSAAIPILSEGLSDEHHRSIRKTAAEVLGMIENDKVIPALRSSLQDPDYAVRRSAAISLAYFNCQEAIPELLKALRHYYPSDDSCASIEIPLNLNEHRKFIIRGMTHELLTSLGDNEAIGQWICEHSIIDIREQVADALGHFSTEEVINELFESLHKGVKAVAVPLGKLGKQEVVPELLELLQDSSKISSSNKVIDTVVFLASLDNLSIFLPLLSILKNINDYKHTDLYFSNRVAIVLTKIAHEAMAGYLPELVTLLSTEAGEQSSWVIAAIQSRCQFYNYNIAQSPPPETQNINMPEASKYNFPRAEKVQIFEQVDTYIENNYPKDETLKQQISELRQLVHQLQQTHHSTNEAEALEIIDVEFRAIQKTNSTRWQEIQKQLQLLKRQLFNPERHLTASKAAIAEVAKHYLEDSVFAKALITYVDTMSADIDQGE